MRMTILQQRLKTSVLTLCSFFLVFVPWYISETWSNHLKKSTWQASFLFNNDLKAIGIGNINTFWLSQHLLRHSRWRQHGGGSAKSPARWLFHCELLRLSCIKLVDADLQTKQPLNEENNRFNEGEGYEGCVAQSWVFKEFFLFVFFWVLEMTWELLMFWACKADEEIVCD